MITLRTSTPADGARIVDIWRRAVDATHDFLSPRDRRDIEAEVVAFLPAATLDLAVDANDRALAFMLLDGSHMEALFVDPDARGTGVGRALVEDALRRYPGLSTDVNEQNAQAIGFYERLGFERTGRSERDGQGRAYPLIHLRHRGDAPA
ncbi:acetyltransferase [Achromobacter xylosoxidans]|uniref:acetyltransferase n=1 Tax=Alcaligenes xylosoxydans xylosoxydans TaxID=85698 RepID=UPI0015643270|nr:acetyltransferase [Achromobacter xylosoxidans]QKI69753.1 acetyltransferase [Achromobacter xylosoxidans]